MSEVPVPGGCRFCRSHRGQVVLDLGRQPSSELFPRSSDPGPDERFPVRMWLCEGCGLAQLADDAALPEEPTGQEPAALTAQRADAVGRLAAAGVLPADGAVVEFPSPHGGTWLDLLAEHGLHAGDPADAADVVVDGCFGIMHDADQLAALRRRAAALRPDGVLVVQYHSLAAILDGSQWNSLRAGHYAYYSTPAMVGMLAGVGLTVTSAHRFELYGATVALTASRGGRPGASVAAVCADEVRSGVLRAAAFADLQDSVRRTSGDLRALLAEQAARGRRVYGYGAASRAVALLSLAGADAGLLRGVADVSPAKHGRRMPGTDVPIISPAELGAAEPDLVLVFVSELLEEARRALPQIEAGGGRWQDAGTGH